MGGNDTTVTVQPDKGKLNISVTSTLAVNNDLQAALTAVLKSNNAKPSFLGQTFMPGGNWPAGGITLLNLDSMIQSGVKLVGRIVAAFAPALDYEQRIANRRAANSGGGSGGGGGSSVGVGHAATVTVGVVELLKEVAAASSVRDEAIRLGGAVMQHFADGVRSHGKLAVDGTHHVIEQAVGDPEVGKKATTLGATIAEHLASGLRGGVEHVRSATRHLLDQADPKNSSVSTHVENAAKGLGKQIAEYLGKGLKDGVAPVRAGVAKLLEAATPNSRNNAEARKMEVAGKALGERVAGHLADGLKQGVDKVRAGVAKLLNAAAKVDGNSAESRQLVKGANELGKFVGEGLANGIHGEIVKVAEAVKVMADKVIEVAKAELDEHSPSVKMMEIGRYAAEGLAKGVESGKTLVGAAAKNATEPISTEAKKAETSVQAMGPASRIASVGFKGMGTALKGAVAGSGLGLLLLLFSPLIQKVIEAVQRTKAFQAVMKLVGKAMDELTKFIDKMTVAAMPALKAGFSAFGKVAQTVWGWIRKYWPWLLGILTGPIGLAVVVIVKNWGRIKSFFQESVSFIKKHWDLILAILTGPVGLAVRFVIQHWNTFISFFEGMPGKIRSIAQSMWNALPSGIKAAINQIIDALNSIDFGIHFHHFGINIDVGNVFPKIPHLADGGLVRARAGGTLALLGEGGSDELVVPLDRSRTSAGALGTTYNVVVNAAPDVPTEKTLLKALSYAHTMYAR